MTPSVGDEAARDGPPSFHRARAAVMTTFAAHALVAGSLGPWIPLLKARSGLDPAELGIALTGYAAGLVLGTRLSGPALRRHGGRRAVRIGVPVLAGWTALLPAAGGLVSLTAIFVGLGLAAGLLDVAMNSEAVTVETRFGRRVISAIHGTWSLAMFAGAGLASAALGARVPIAIQAPFLAVLLVMASFPLLRWLPSPSPDAAAAGAPTGSTGDRPAGIGKVIQLCLIAAASFLTEGIAADWSAVYLRESVGTDPGTAGLGVVAFSAGMATARFAGDRVSARIDQSILVRGGTALAAAALASALVVGGVIPSIAALALIGLSLGPVVPFVFRTAGRIARRDGRTSLSIVVTAGYVGSIVGPLIVGFIADRIGLRAAFIVPVIACVIAALAAGATRDA